MNRNGVTLGTALARGFARKCPNCGQASAFRGYVKVVDQCSNCHEPLNEYPADDGPAYVTIILIGHVVVVPALFLNVLYAYPPMVVLPILLGTIVALTLIALPYIKGAFLALVWELNVRRR